MKLNLGCFNSRIDGFTNVDIRKLEGVDIVCDVKKLDFPDNSIEEIYASHVLEHFHYIETLDVLKEWYRVLVPGGKIYIGVPDLEVMAGLITIYGMCDWVEAVIYGSSEYIEAKHQAGFGFSTLKNKMEKAGFINIRRVDSFNLTKRDATSLNVTINNTPLGIFISLNVIAQKGVQNGSI